MVRVVDCTVARPLVRILSRGGVPWCSGFGYVGVAGAVGIVIRWAAELRRMIISWLWLRRRGFGLAEMPCRNCRL